MGGILSSDYFEPVTVAIGVGLFFAHRWLNNRPPKTSKYNFTQVESDASLIMTMFTLGVGLRKLTSGTVAGFPYSLLITTNVDIPTVETGMAVDGGVINVSRKIIPVPAGTVPAPEGQIIMSVDLPTKSTVHIAGFSMQDTTFRQLLGNTSLDNTMTQVQLEGSFPDYFKLYCDKGREIELRQVLDPPRMLYLVDFCESFNFELAGSNLYFVVSNTGHRPGNETMVQAAQDFAQKILPTLQRMSAAPSAPHAASLSPQPPLEPPPRRPTR